MKKDLFSECFDGRVSPEEFKNTFCDHCRNPSCALAKWDADKFGSRVQTQMDRLFNPTFADPANPKHRRVREQDFPSLFKEAIRLETADRVGDWSIPSENVVLANIAPEPASEESKDLVERAVRSLKGKDQGDQVEDQVLPSEALEAQSGDQEVAEDNSGNSEKKEKHTKTKTSNKRKPETKLGKETTEQKTLPPTEVSERQKNTDFSDGFTIGGDLPSQDIDGTPTKKQRVLESWGSSSGSKVVEPGSKIKMGKKK